MTPTDPPTTPGSTESVLLIAHGSRNPAAAVDHERLCEQVARSAGVAVRPAYLELSEPSVPDAVAAVVAEGATRVRLVPLFLHTGNHVQRDLPALAEAARAAHPGVEIALDEHVGADPGLVTLVAARLAPATAATTAPATAAPTAPATAPGS